MNESLGLSLSTPASSAAHTSFIGKTPDPFSFLSSGFCSPSSKRNRYKHFCICISNHLAYIIPDGAEGESKWMTGPEKGECKDGRRNIRNNGILYTVHYQNIYIYIYTPRQIMHKILVESTTISKMGVEKELGSAERKVFFFQTRKYYIFKAAQGK